MCSMSKKGGALPAIRDSRGFGKMKIEKLYRECCAGWIVSDFVDEIDERIQWHKGSGGQKSARRKEPDYMP